MVSLNRVLIPIITLLILGCNITQVVSQTEPTNLFPTKEVVTRYHNDWTINSYKQRIKMFKKDTPEFGDIFFIGNSITQQGRDWTVKFGIDHIKNRGIAGDVTDGVLARLDEIIYYKPKAIFILIGINDLFNLHHEKSTRKTLKYDKIIPSAKYVGNNIVKIARTLHRKLPDTKIFVRTVLPTRREYLKDDILIVNSIIKEKESKGHYNLIDLYSLFVDESGDMKKELTKDGVHLNEKGYDKWVKFEKMIIEEL